jgi:hypothetical protein
MNPNQPAAQGGHKIGDDFFNVLECYPIFDTLIVTPQFYGSENSADGWYNTFVAMGQDETHSFFKQRTIANVGLAYSNKEIQDQMDFAYEAYSIGCAFFAPSIRTLWEYVTPEQRALPTRFHSQIAHWWEAELPRHCSIELKVQQDIVSELNCMNCSPGYGPVNGGGSFAHDVPFRDLTEGTENPDYHPVMIQSVTQGVPDIGNRFNLVTYGENGEVRPLGIPRTAVVEARITVSQFARNFLKNMIGVTPAYLFGGENGEPQGSGYKVLPARFGVQVSLIGRRGVQQRGRYHR